MDEPFLELCQLTRAFGGVRAVDGVDLSLAAGALRCIIGPNGCGKTTLFNLITGYLRPTAGSVRFRGRDMTGQTLHAVARAGIVRKFQVPSVFSGLPVIDNLRAARAARTPDRADGPSVDALLETVGLAGQRDEPASTLSHGRKQWLELAMVLATQPSLVLLDEPAAGMTRAERTQTVRLIDTLRTTTGIGVLVIEHDMAFVEALDCPVTAMVLGRIVADGNFGDIRADAQVRAAYLGPTHA